MYEYQNNPEHHAGNAMMAFGIGMIAGAVTALLLAPASGQETRRRLGQMTNRLGEKAREGADQAKHFIDEQKDRFKGAVEEGRQTFMKESAGTPPGVRSTTHQSTPQSTTTKY